MLGLTKLVVGTGDGGSVYQVEEETVNTGERDTKWDKMHTRFFSEMLDAVWGMVQGEAAGKLYLGFGEVEGRRQWVAGWELEAIEELLGVDCG